MTSVVAATADFAVDATAAQSVAAQTGRPEPVCVVAHDVVVAMTAQPVVAKSDNQTAAAVAVEAQSVAVVDVLDGTPVLLARFVVARAGNLVVLGTGNHLQAADYWVVRRAEEMLAAVGSTAAAETSDQLFVAEGYFL